MTVAVCIRCGQMKEGAFLACGRCDFQPVKDRELALSVAFTDHYMDMETLEQTSAQLAAGHPLPMIPSELETTLLDAVRDPTLRRMVGFDQPGFGQEFDVRVLRACTLSIRKDLTTLDDLPERLAEFIVTIYYRAMIAVAQVRRPGWIPESIKTQGMKGFDPARLVKETAGMIAKQRAVPLLVQGLRQIDRQSQPRLYDYKVDLMLDLLVFEIPNAQKKPEVWRAVQRRLREPKIVPMRGLLPRVKAKLAIYEDDRKAASEAIDATGSPHVLR